MAILTEKQLADKAKKVFSDHPGAELIYQTSDGHCWLPGFKDLADDHARKHKVKVHEVSRPKKEKVTKETPPPTGDAEKEESEGAAGGDTEGATGSTTEDQPAAPAASEKKKSSTKNK